MNDKVSPIRDDAAMNAARQKINDLSGKDHGLYHGGGSDGGNGMSDLNHRVAHLEGDMKELKSDMKNVRDRLAKIEGEISRLPGYPGIALIMGVIVTLATAAQKILPSVAP